MSFFQLLTTEDLPLYGLPRENYFLLLASVFSFTKKKCQDFSRFVFAF